MFSFPRLYNNHINTTIKPKPKRQTNLISQLVSSIFKNNIHSTENVAITLNQRATGSAICRTSETLYTIMQLNSFKI